MTISYLLGFSPKWVVLDNQGRPAAGGKLYTYSNLDKDLPKAAYSDQAGNNPYPNPIVFDANGTKGPIFFKSDSLALNDTYYLRMYDANNNFLWDEENYTGAGSGGGGGVITDDVDIANLITNGVFWATPQSIGSTFATATNLVIAPGAKDSFVEGANTGGPTGPNIVFAKNNTNATDTLEYINFALGSTILAPDITPQYYLRYACTILGAAETYKYVQFPVTPKVQNLTNSTVTAVIYARCTAGDPTLQLYLRQFYGDGGGSAEVRVALGAPITLTASWAKYSVTGTVPDASTKTIGDCNNDALFLQVGYPLSQVSTIDFVKVALYNGDFNPDVEFLTMDQIDAVINSPYTGDIKVSLSSVTPPGWVRMDDGSIGSPTSGATTRANVDTFPLYSRLWNSVSDTWAPVATGRGATAQDDFAANKALTMPKSLGRALAGFGTGAGLTARALGESLGTETNTFIVTNLPAAFSLTLSATVLANIPGGGGSTLTGISGASTSPVNVTVPGGGVPLNNMEPTTFMNVFIKL